MCLRFEPEAVGWKAQTNPLELPHSSSSLSADVFHCLFLLPAQCMQACLFSMSYLHIRVQLYYVCYFMESSNSQCAIFGQLYSLWLDPCLFCIILWETFGSNLLLSISQVCNLVFTKCLHISFEQSTFQSELDLRGLSSTAKYSENASEHNSQEYQFSHQVKKPFSWTLPIGVFLLYLSLRFLPFLIFLLNF